MARTFHFALAALVLGIAALGTAFGLGYEAPGWFGAPTQTTEAVLALGVLAAVILLFGAIAVEGKERTSRAVGGIGPRPYPASFRGNSRGVGGWKGHHIGWLFLSLVFLLLVSAASYAWAVVYEGADLVSAGVIAFLVFLLAGLLIAVIFVGMKTRDWAKGRGRRG
jgi:Co/Zn/Cd efflux system component